MECNFDGNADRLFCLGAYYFFKSSRKRSKIKGLTFEDNVLEQDRLACMHVGGGADRATSRADPPQGADGDHRAGEGDPRPACDALGGHGISGGTGDRVTNRRKGKRGYINCKGFLQKLLSSTPLTVHISTLSG